MEQKMSFSELINGETPVLVDFMATWCGPCIAMAPILEEVAGKFGDRVRIVKVDVDQNRALAAHFNIYGVPTFILFKKGEAVWRQSGMVSASFLEELLERHAAPVASE